MLDTALALLAFAELGFPAGEVDEVIDGLAFLVQTQGLGADSRAWTATVGADAPDAVVTSLALRALAVGRPLWEAQLPGNTDVEDAGDDALSFLQASVTEASPPLRQAHAVLALLRWDPASTAPWISERIDDLEASQIQTGGGAGSWEQDAYVTAVALQALAARLGKDAPSQQANVGLPDLGLRAAINLALAKNRVDAITKGEMLSLLYLDARNAGVEDLAGIEEAENLVTIDLRGNQIADLSPLDLLAALERAQVAEPCDVDLDGQIATPDAQILLRAVATGEGLPIAEFTSADVAPPGAVDGVLTAGDAVPVLRAAAGITTTACGD